MTGIFRPPRGRPNKVTKPSSPTVARRQNRTLLADAVVAEQHRIQQQDHQSAIPQNPVAATATAGEQQQHQQQFQEHLHQQLQQQLQQQQQHLQQHLHEEDDLGVGATVGTAVGTGIEDDDPQAHHHMVDLEVADTDNKPDPDPSRDDAAKAVEMASTVTHNMDLSTAASILANGGSLLDAPGPVQATYGSAAPPGQADQVGQTGQAGQAGHTPTGGAAHHLHHHHHQHPQQAPVQHSLDFVGAPVRSTEELARESGYHSLIAESALAKRLAREPGLRPAQQRRPEQSLNLNRRSNVEALFAHIAGEEVAQPCKNCHKGHGPWTACVTVDGQMCGSCANCWFNASGARCSFHETRNSNQIQLQHQQHQQHPHHHPHHPNHNNNNPLQTPGSVSAQDASAYGMGSPMNLGPPPPAPTQGSIDFASALNMGDPTVSFTVDRAMREVRAADLKARQLMRIEIAAKQLALSILEYEATVASEGQDGQEGQDGPDGQSLTVEDGDMGQVARDSDGHLHARAPDGHHHHHHHHHHNQQQQQQPLGLDEEEGAT